MKLSNHLNLMENPKELLADKIIREKAEKQAVKTAKKTAKKEVADDVADFFKKYPDAPSVLKVGDCLYLSIHKGAASEYARRMELEVEEITNPL